VVIGRIGHESYGRHDRRDSAGMHTYLHIYAAVLQHIPTRYFIEDPVQRRRFFDSNILSVDYDSVRRAQRYQTTYADVLHSPWRVYGCPIVDRDMR